MKLNAYCSSDIANVRDLPFESVGADVWGDDERQLRAAFATVLQENAQLHKAVNAALRSGGVAADAAAAAAVHAVSVASAPRTASQGPDASQGPQILW